MILRPLRWVLVLALAIVVVQIALPSQVQASPTESIQVVTSHWSHQLHTGSADPDWVYVGAEIRNTSGQYLNNVAVRVRLFSLSGAELYQTTGAPLRTALAPGESTFFWKSMKDDNFYLTASAEFQAFGDPSDPVSYPYLPDPQPLYLNSYVDGGWVTYYGEIVNLTSKTWKAPYASTDATYLHGVYYEDGKIADYWWSGSPPGHLAPGGKIAFRFQFERVPNASFKLFSRVEPLPAGSYATTWAVDNLQWTLKTDAYGYKSVDITARIRNTSDVSAKPHVWFVGRNATGQWLGWTSCFLWDEVAPGGTVACAESISSGFMHLGEPQDIQSVEALVGSSALTYQGPPTLTPTPSPTPTLTPTPTATRTPHPDWWPLVYLPLILR